MLASPRIGVRATEQAGLLCVVRCATVRAREIRREQLLPRGDVGSALGPEPGQRRIDANDLAHRTLTVPIRPFGEPDSKLRDQQRLEPGVVPLGRGHRRPVQRPSIQGEPPAVDRLHLVRDRHVRVQVGVAGT